MSDYEAAVEQWKGQTSRVEPPNFDSIEQRVTANDDPSLPGGRRTFMIRASLGVVVAGFAGMALLEQFVLPKHMRSGRTMAVMLPMTALIVAMRWIRNRDLAAQMMVRALTWSALVIGTIVSVFGRNGYVLLGPVIALGAGTALLLMGTRGLGMTSRSFAPMAFRNHLLLALVLATADAGTLLFAGTMQLSMAFTRAPEYLLVAAPTLLCGFVMALAVWGIYRLRTWALVLNLLANLAIAFVAMSGYLGLTIPVATALAATATLQLLLPVPILAAALGDPLRDRKPLGRLGPYALRLGLFAMMLLGFVGPVLPLNMGPFTLYREGWVAAVQRTWVRGLEPRRATPRGIPDRVKRTLERKRKR